MFRGDFFLSDSRYRAWSVIALVAIVTAILLRPFQNFPSIDDWVYAWSVENLLRTGRIEILDLSTSVNLAQILWGGLFSLPFGFSFTALRISTWVLSVIGLCALYELLREMQVSHRDALLGSLLLLAYPVYFMLSFTFMTDIPWLAMTIAFCCCLVKAVRRKRVSWLVAAAVFAFLAGTIRATGLALPFVMIAVLFFHSAEWGRNPRRLAIPLICLTALAAAVFYGRIHVSYRADLSWLPGSPQYRIANLKYGLLYLYWWIPEGLVSAAAVLGVASILWTVGTVRKRDVIESKFVFAAALLILAGSLAAGVNYYPPLKLGEIWSIHELGASESLVPNAEPPAMPVWASWMLGILFYPIFALAALYLVRRPHEPGMAAVQWLVGLAFLEICVLWLFNDRYFLMVLPFVAAAVLSRGGFSRPYAALIVGVLFLTVSMIGVRDHLAYNQALWRAVALSRERGVSEADIDGGYMVNGWLKYANPENERKNDKGLEVNYVNASGLEIPYQLSNRPREGWMTIDAVPYARWLGRSGAIYILRRRE
ncbi:MAG TPA: glycosyltransferase family 39 protein [Candidatus Binatia bacterium]